MSLTSIPPRRRRILVVEDETSAREALCQALSDRYDVLGAADGMEGIEVAERFQPDLIVSDISMPRLGGLAMVKHIRARLERRVPVVFLTALDSPQAVIAGIAAGARHYLTKPVNLEDLDQRVQRLLGA